MESQEQDNPISPESKFSLGKSLKKLGSLALKTTAVVVLAGIAAVPVGDALVDRWADRAADRIKQRSQQVDLSEAQIDNFKRNIEDQDLLEFFAEEIQDERGDMTPQELVNCLFNDSEACKPSNDKSPSSDNVIELTQGDIDDFNERFNADLGIGPGPYEPEFLLAMIFPEPADPGN